MTHAFLTPFRRLALAAAASLFAVSATLTVVQAASAHYVPPPETDGTAGTPEPTSEEVSAFVADITVNDDGTVTVNEHISYFFPSSRHGIYRDIPVRYRMDDGRLLEVPVTVDHVTMGDGSAVPFEEQRNGNYLRLKIGDPDLMVSGAQEYDISYVVSGALRYFEDHDELYWNVTGHAWEVPLRRVSARVTLPASMPAGDVPQLACFTGPEGSTASDCLHSTQGGRAEFVAEGPMTVVVGWPPGLVAKLEAKDISGRERASAMLPFLLPVAVFAFLLRRWHLHGRDPKGRGTHMVEYEAPDKLTPAEVGTMIDGTAGNTDISAIIVDLAVRGYLVIREVETKGLLSTSKDYEFELIKAYADDASLKEFERKMLSSLFVGSVGSKVLVSDIKKNQTFYKDRAKIGAMIMKQLVSGGYFTKNPNTVIPTYVGIGIALIAAAPFASQLLKPTIGQAASFSALAAGLLTGIVVICFAPLMVQPTQKGVLAKEKAKGFKEYLNKAEKYRLQWQEKEHIFEKFMPYAMAFGVAAAWAKAFEGMHLPPPTWYHGSAVQAGLFNPVVFAGSMKDLNSKAIAAMNSAPQSSSSGSGFSGGSSGGGFGGGGGGSW